MGFPSRLLNQGEDIILDLHPHWILLLGPFFWALVIIVALAIITLFSSLLPPPIPWLVAAVGFVCLLFLVIIKYLAWLSTEFVLTTERVISRHGVFTKWAKDIPLNRINDVTFSQTVMERILGSGNLAIESAGEQGQNRFVFIRNPELVQNAIYKAMEAWESRSRPVVGAAAPADDIPAQIARLAELKEKGILTGEEFDKKKADLLNRM